MSERREFFDKLIVYLPLLAAIPVVAMTLISFADIFILDLDHSGEALCTYIGIIFASICLTCIFLNTFTTSNDNTSLGVSTIIYFFDVWAFVSMTFGFVYGMRLFLDDQLGYYLNFALLLCVVIAILFSFFRRKHVCMIISRISVIIFMISLVLDCIFDDDIPSAFLRIPVGFFISWGAFFLLKGVFYHFINVDDINVEMKKTNQNIDKQLTLNKKAEQSNSNNNNYSNMYTSPATQQAMPQQTTPATHRTNAPANTTPTPVVPQTVPTPKAPVKTATQPAPRSTSNSRLQRFIDKGNQ